MTQLSPKDQQDRERIKKLDVGSIVDTGWLASLSKASLEKLDRKMLRHNLELRRDRNSDRCVLKKGDEGDETELEVANIDQEKKEITLTSVEPKAEERKYYESKLRNPDLKYYGEGKYGDK